jgi:hypothetical protein
MKKFVIFALIAAMAAGVAFAQTADGISINAFGRGVFVPLQSVGAPKAAGEDVKVGGDTVEGRNYAGTQASWGGAVRTDFRVNGNAEFVGFQVQVKGDGGTAGIENTHIWAKPFGSDILKLTIGRYEVDNLRGKIATDTGFEDFVVGGHGEDKIFNRFRGNGGTANAIITSEPMEGLFIGIEIPGQTSSSNRYKEDYPWDGSNFGWGSYDKDDLTWSDKQKLLDAYRFIQIGFGYQIPDIGHFRAQWLGGWFGSIDAEQVAKDIAKGKFDVGPNPDPYGNDNSARIEVAFALTAVDNLLVDLGLKFWLPMEAADDYAPGGGADPIVKGAKFSKGVDLGLGANFRADAFAVTATVVANFGSYSREDKDDKSANGISLDINLIPTYDLDAATIGASIGLRTKGNGKVYNGDAAEKTETSQFGFGGFVRKDLGSGHIKAGLAYATAPTVNGKANGSGVFTIPIVLEYAFF